MKRLRIAMMALALLCAAAAVFAADAPKKIKIEFWYSWGDKIAETNETLAREFNESQDRIEVKASYQGSYNDLQSKLQAAYVAKTAPTVALNETASVGVFARAGISADLGPFAKRDNYDLKNITAGLLTNSYIDGKLVSIPYMRSTPLMFVNATLLKANGLDPAGPKTWNDLLRYGEVLSKKGITALSFPMVNEWYFEAFLGQVGSRIFNEDESAPAFNSKAGETVLDFWREMQKKGYSRILTGSDSGTMFKALFQSQNAAMVFSSVADINYFTDVSRKSGFQLATAFLPGNQRNAIPTGGANMILVSNRSKEELEAGWEFIKFVTRDAQTIYTSKNTGYVPLTYSAVKTPEMVKFYTENPQFKVAVDQLEYILARPKSKVAAEVHAQVKDMVIEFLLNDSVSAKTVLAKYEQKCKDIIAGR